jgi:two-component system LytT family response regulator
MLKTIIVDDEKHCSDRVAKLLGIYDNQFEIVAVFSDIESAFEGICQCKPEVVFLDIQIHDKTGFDLLRKFDTIDFDVVFTTAFEDYAIKAIKFSAFDYLLKPIDSDDFAQTIKRLTDKNRAVDSTKNYDMLLQNLAHIKNNTKRIVIQTQTETLLINVQDIIRCESDINYTTIYLNTKKTIVVSKTLKDFENLLTPYNFFRVHNSHLINLEYMKSYDKGKGGYVHLSDNTVVEVSVRRKDDLMQKLNQL